MNCSICGKPDDLECPACDKSFCISCFVGHGKTCYEQSKKQAEQGEPEKKACPDCGLKYTASSQTQWVHCSYCQKTVCLLCYGYHRRGNHHVGEERLKVYHCTGCDKIQAQDPNKSGSPFWECPSCHKEYCAACCMTHRHIYTHSNLNLHDFIIHGVDFEVNTEFLRETFEAAKKVARETAKHIKKEEEERKRKEQEEARRRKEQEEWFRDFWGAGQQTYASSYGIDEAFSLLQLSTRATVQEVKRAFKQHAKTGDYRHPDVGGSEDNFKKLNNAYEMALAHAKRNER